MQVIEGRVDVAATIGDQGEEPTPCGEPCDVASTPGNRVECRDGDKRKVEGQTEADGKGDSDADTGKGAGADGNGDPLELIGRGRGDIQRRTEHVGKEPVMCVPNTGLGPGADRRPLRRTGRVEAALDAYRTGLGHRTAPGTTTLGPAPAQPPL